MPISTVSNAHFLTILLVHISVFSPAIPPNSNTGKTRRHTRVYTTTRLFLSCTRHAAPSMPLPRRHSHAIVPRSLLHLFCRPITNHIICACLPPRKEFLMVDESVVGPITNYVSAFRNETRIFEMSTSWSIQRRFCLLRCRIIMKIDYFDVCCVWNRFVCIVERPWFLSNQFERGFSRKFSFLWGGECARTLAKYMIYVAEV